MSAKVAKRRTRKQKIQARHQYIYSWSPGSENKLSKPVVKGQFKNRSEAQISGSLSIKKAKKLAKAEGSSEVRRDIIKSLILASLVLSLELVIYLAWNR